MQKSTLCRSMKQLFGSGMLNQTQVGEFLGLGRDCTRDFCRGLDYFPTGRNKLYAVEDIADRIIEGRRNA